jgi:hypothetical protein
MGIGPRQAFHAAAALVAIGFACAPTGAGAIVIGSESVVGDRIVGQWELPVLTGVLIDAATRGPYPPGLVDDSGSAVYSLGATTPSSSTTLTWGDYPDAPTSTIPSSSITFTGNSSIPASKGTTDFSVGSFSYTNGTSLNGSEIFGATLVLYAVGLDGNIPIGSINFVINSTVNDGNNVQNADWLQVEGVTNTFQAYEGATLSGALNGIIVGDPSFIPHNFALDPGQEANGFLGGATGSVPEPSTWAMMALGFAGLGFAGFRRARKHAIAAA